MSGLIGTDGGLVEFGYSRGDLLTQPIYGDAGGYAGPLSCSRLFTSQPLVATVASRLLLWAELAPLQLFERRGPDDLQALSPSDHPAARSLDTPWPGGSDADLVTALLGPRLVHGNAVLGMRRLRGGGLRWEPSQWERSRALLDRDADTIEGWEVLDTHGRVTDTWTTARSLHIKRWSPVGPFGLSPLTQLGVTVRRDEVAQETASAVLKQGARPSGLISLVDDAWLGFDPKDRQEALQVATVSARTEMAGAHNAGRLGVMPPGTEWVDVKPGTAQELALIEQRIVHAKEAEAMYGCPVGSVLPLGDLPDKPKDLRLAAITDGLMPVLSSVESQVTAALRTFFGDDSLEARFDTTALLRGDRLAEIQAISTGVQSGVLRPNEGRSRLGLSKDKAREADFLYLPKNNLRSLADEQGQRALDLAMVAQRLGQAVTAGGITQEQAQNVLDSMITDLTGGS